MNNDSRPCSFDRVLSEIARLGPVGRLPIAPGTWGSLAAILAAPWVFMPLSWPLRIVVLIGLFFVGAWCASAAERVLQRKDPQSVSIDEVLGQWITLIFFPTPLGLPSYVAAFFLFRLFDIAKPWPVRQAENWLPKGYGVMIDDVLAGLYAALGLALFRWALVHISM